MLGPKFKKNCGKIEIFEKIDYFHWNCDFLWNFHWNSVLYRAAAHKKELLTSGAKHSPPILLWGSPSGKSGGSTKSMVTAVISQKSLKFNLDHDPMSSRAFFYDISSIICRLRLIFEAIEMPRNRFKENLRKIEIFEKIEYFHWNCDFLWSFHWNSVL